MIFIEVKALGGINYLRADMVVAVSQNDPAKCNVLMQGAANTIPCSEPAKDVVARIEQALSAPKES